MIIAWMNKTAFALYSLSITPSRRGGGGATMPLQLNNTFQYRRINVNACCMNGQDSLRAVSITMLTPCRRGRGNHATPVNNTFRCLRTNDWEMMHDYRYNVWILCMNVDRMNAFDTGIYCGYRACENYIGESERGRLVIDKRRIFYIGKPYYYRDQGNYPSVVCVKWLLLQSLLMGKSFLSVIISLVKWYSRSE